jgi:phenylacetate-coenzyme A ligase PaaK-like adenylate-forming protein
MSESFLRLLWDARSARKHGPSAVAQRQRARLAEMVTYARARSPYYHELYQSLPEQVDDPKQLPITDKKKLMVRFDDWMTDREVTVEKVRAFINNLDLIGEKFLGKYTVATTSGTTGTPGIFLMDDRAFTMTNVLVLRMLRA